MRHAPYQKEVESAAAMSEAARLEYFLTRVFEAEEVWGLDDGCEWIVEERDGQQLMPLWPYEQFAQAAAQFGWKDCLPAAESLEDFLYNTLPGLIAEDYMLNIMATPGVDGCFVSPQRLYAILEGMIEAGEYKLDA
ncbi:DUF2750 domain-containing protein [Parahaliea maris]|uniref:DUF2750 domain-containing protein n=1 Tax=Parahaliea maris TaxID=2716870 RepID=A0A5C9A6Q4_9GAMM|nr:DUF2750 domain-containing protein [Parahaliea maris]TXS95642.1 DUF2750 domain-containing protein [Parahaliea maris]